jgi:hypothetical protein
MFQKKPSAITGYFCKLEISSLSPLYFGLLSLSGYGSTEPIEFGSDHWFRLALAFFIDSIEVFIGIVLVLSTFLLFS